MKITLMKQTYLFFILFILCCSPKITTNNKTNIFTYDNKVKITLPDRFYLESSVIYDNDSVKLGEFLPGLITPINNLSFPDIFNLSKKGGEIKAKETNFTYDDYQSKIIEVDSIQLTNYKWYYILKQTTFDGEGGNGLWESYDFITIQKDKILFVTLYNKEIKTDKLDFFTKIITTIKIK
jgi:hypothetical protein